MKKKETKEVPKVWLEGLLKCSERLEQAASVQGEQHDILVGCAMSYLRGYIQSAKTLL